MTPPALAMALALLEHALASGDPEALRRAAEATLRLMFELRNSWPVQTPATTKKETDR